MYSYWWLTCKTGQLHAKMIWIKLVPLQFSQGHFLLLFSLRPFSIIRAIQLSSRKTNSVWVRQITLRNCYLLSQLQFSSRQYYLTPPPPPPNQKNSPVSTENDSNFDGSWCHESHVPILEISSLYKHYWWNVQLVITYIERASINIHIFFPLNPFAPEPPVTAHADPRPFYPLWRYQF